MCSCNLPQLYFLLSRHPQFTLEDTDEFWHVYVCGSVSARQHFTSTWQCCITCLPKTHLRIFLWETPLHQKMEQHFRCLEEAKVTLPCNSDTVLLMLCWKKMARKMNGFLFTLTLPVEFWQHLRGTWQSHHEHKIFISCTDWEMTAEILTGKDSMDLTSIESFHYCKVLPIMAI